MENEREGDKHSNFKRRRKWPWAKEEVEKTHPDLQELNPPTMEEDKKNKKQRTPPLSPWTVNTRGGGVASLL